VVAPTRNRHTFIVRQFSKFGSDVVGNNIHQENLLELHASLQKTRKELENTEDRGQLLQIAISVREKVEPIFEQLNKDAQNGILPPLPELSAINRAFFHYWINSEMANALFYSSKYLEYQRAYLRYLFEVGDSFNECDCLIIARLPVHLSPQHEKLRKIGGSDDLYDTYTDYECEVCGSQWRLNDASTESVSDAYWRLLRLEPKDVVFADYDKYGNALAESRAQIALNVDTVKQILKENLEISEWSHKNYSLFLGRLAMLGIVEDKGLTKIITDSLDKISTDEKVQIWDILDAFLDKEAEKWPI